MAKAKADQPPVVEEIQFRSESAFLCLVLNRRTKLIRVIDFRAGALPAKRLFIQSVAQREGVEKIITLVEKDEVSSWTKVGFVREGQIPGFYKRSDGHLCGCVVGEKSASPEVGEEGGRVAERTVNHARKAAKEIPETLRGVTVRELEPVPALKARDEGWKRGLAVGAFDPFGRDASSLFFECSGRKSKPNHLYAEYQDCFGHSVVEVLRTPASDTEIAVVTGGLRALSEKLKEQGIVAAFGFAPSDDLGLATAYTAAGFRKTGLLARGILTGGVRKDAILWTRKLLNPAGGDEE